jgi:hypothetical protein
MNQGLNPHTPAAHRPVQDRTRQKPQLELARF